MLVKRFLLIRISVLIVTSSARRNLCNWYDKDSLHILVGRQYAIRRARFRDHQSLCDRLPLDDTIISTIALLDDADHYRFYLTKGRIRGHEIEIWRNIYIYCTTLICNCNSRFTFSSKWFFHSFILLINVSGNHKKVLHFKIGFIQLSYIDI